MLNMEKQRKSFANHVATFTDYGNVKILDFKNPKSNEYRIRFLFEEDYCRLHISGDLGELIATNYNNMCFNGFKDFVDNTSYFEEKIDCHNRALYCYDKDDARADLMEYIEDYGLRDTILETREPWEYDVSDDEFISEVVERILEDMSDETGISAKGYDILYDLYCEAWVFAHDIGKRPTGILEVYMLAFKLATEQLEKRK